MRLAFSSRQRRRRSNAPCNYRYNLFRVGRAGFSLFFFFFFFSLDKKTKTTTTDDDVELNPLLKLRKFSTWGEKKWSEGKVDDDGNCLPLERPFRDRWARVLVLVFWAAAVYTSTESVNGQEQWLNNHPSWRSYYFLFFYFFNKKKKKKKVLWQPRTGLGINSFIVFSTSPSIVFFSFLFLPDHKRPTAE